MSISENSYRFYMHYALEEARIALQHDEVPIGAIVVDTQGIIIGRGHNLVEARHSQDAHAERCAIRQATASRRDWRLEGCFIFVSLEPCLMCFGLITLSRIGGVIYGAPSPLFGVGLDNKECFRLYKKDLLIHGGVQAQESIALLQAFFRKRRGHSKEVV